MKKDKQQTEETKLKNLAKPSEEKKKINYCLSYLCYGIVVINNN